MNFQGTEKKILITGHTGFKGSGLLAPEAGADLMDIKGCAFGTISF